MKKLTDEQKLKAYKMYFKKFFKKATCSVCQTSVNVRRDDTCGIWFCYPCFKADLMKDTKALRAILKEADKE
jgi:ribosomal protein L37AE/L43A